MTRRVTIAYQPKDSITLRDSRRSRLSSRQKHCSLTGVEELECRRLLAFDFEVLRSPSDLPSNAEFGKSVAISDGLAVVGAPRDDDGGSNSGSVYIYDRRPPGTQDNWVEMPPKLTASDASAGDRFGWSVAMDGDTIVVGAMLDDDQGMSSGSVYVFERSGNDEWQQTDKLTADDGAMGALFGYSVAISGNRIVVGAPFASVGGIMTGKAYVFERNGSSWRQEDELIADDADFGDDFGTSVAVSGDSIAVGANRDDDNGQDSGSVYIFEPGSHFRQIQKLTAPDGHAGDCYGFSLAMHRSALVVGAFLHDGGGSDAGIAYVYDQSSPFSFTTSLTPSDQEADAHFGFSVSIDGDLIIVGAPGENAGASDAGAAYVFDRTSGVQIERLTADSPGSGDRLGESVAISAGTGPGSQVAVVGAPSDDTSVDPGSVRFFVDSNADLAITKDDGVTVITAGDGVSYTYTITVQNLGVLDAENVVVNDTFPDDFTQGTVTASQGSTNAAGDDFTANLGAIAAGGSATITVDYSVAFSVAAGFYTNTVVVSSDTPDGNAANNMDDDTNEVVTNADLMITKDDGVTVITAGDGVSYTYTITVQNLGDSDAQNVVVNDTFPDDFTQGTVTASQGNTNAAGDDFTANLGAIAAGGSATITVDYSVASSVAAGFYTNTAVVSSDTPDNNPANNMATDTNEVVTNADLMIIKDDGVTDITAGDGMTYTYTITVQNLGDSDAENVVVNDFFPDEFTQGMVTASQGSTHLTNTTGFDFTANLGAITAGGSATITVDYSVASSVAAGFYTNTAVVSSDTPDDNPANNMATDTNEVVTNADLMITKDDGVTDITAGDGMTYTYTITVQNLGDSDAENVVVNDFFPDEFTQGMVTASQGSTHLTNTTGFDFTANLGAIAAGGSATITVDYTVASSVAAGFYTNTAVVSSDTPDDNPANNMDDDTNEVVTNADLMITKDDGVTDNITAGDDVTYTYTITVQNLGVSAAENVVVNDTFPDDFTQGTVTASQGTTNAAGDDFTANLGAIAAGGSATITVDYTVASSVAAGRYTNAVVVSSDTPDGKPANNRASEDTDVQVSADLSIEKRAQPFLGVNQFLYTIVVQNDGPSDVVGATVVDNFPSELDMVRYTSTTSGSVSGNTPIGDGNINDVVTMAVRSSITYFVTAVVPSSTTGVLENTATVTPPVGTMDPVDNNNSATVFISIIPVADNDDDAEECGNDAVAVMEEDLTLGTDFCGEGEFPPIIAYTVGIRFADVNIPPGALIESARIQFTAREADDVITSVSIYGELSANAEFYEDEVGNISSRPKTTSSVDWQIEEEWQMDDDGPNQKTPELYQVVQEVIDQDGWQSNNAIAFIIKGSSGNRNAYAFEGDEDRVPRLTITFSVGETAASGSVGDPVVNVSRSDVNQDGFVSPLDALLVINYLHSPTKRDDSSFALDVNADGILSPLDALWIIDHLGAASSASAIQEPNRTDAFVAPWPALADEALRLAYYRDHDSDRDLPDAARALAEIYNANETYSVDDLLELPSDIHSLAGCIEKWAYTVGRYC